VALFGPPNVERLVDRQDTRGLLRALDYERDPEVRRKAAEALGLMADEQALAPLIFRLNDDDLEVRKAAARALGQLGDPRAVDALTSLVEQGPEELAMVAIRALGEIGSADATPTLITILLDEDTELRDSASQALARIGVGAVFPLLRRMEGASEETQNVIRQTLRRMGPEAVNDLAMQVADRRNLERSKAAQALGEIGNADAVEALVKSLNSSDLHVQPAVMSALATIGEPSVDALIQALESESTLLVRSAIDALGRVGSPRAAGPLRHVAATRNAVLRDLALKAMARIPDEAAIGPLIEQLQAEAWTARRQAAIALAQANRDLAVPALIGALSDPEPVVARAAASSLDLHKWKPKPETDPVSAAAFWVALRYWDRAVALGEAAIGPLMARLEDAAWEDRRGPTDALIQLGEPAVQPLIEALQNEDSGVRHSAAYALGRIEEAKETEAGEAVKELLTDANESVRAAAARSLGLLGVTEAVPLLIERLHDVPAVRANASSALAMFGDEAIPALAEALQDEDADVRAAAAEALGASKSADAVTPLIDALSDEAESVRLPVARGLARLGDLAVPILVERLADEETGMQIALSAILGQIGNQDAVPALYPLLGHENETVRLTAAAALQNLWIESRETSEPLHGVSALFVMTLTTAPQDEELQRWLISESFADLGTDRPDITEVHTLMMVDQSRLHETFEPLPEQGYDFPVIVEQFRNWIAEQGAGLEEWESRFYHREIMTEESPDAHIVCLFYAL
jgi:HEAT repeat protein